MPVLIPRTRSISVRLSDQEFAALQRFCVAKGLRSISDLTRNAICGLLSHADSENNLISNMVAYSAQIKGLEQKVEQLTAEIELFKKKKKPSITSTNEQGDFLQPVGTGRAND